MKEYFNIENCEREWLEIRREIGFKVRMNLLSLGSMDRDLPTILQENASISQYIFEFSLDNLSYLKKQSAEYWSNLILNEKDFILKFKEVERKLRNWYCIRANDDDLGIKAFFQKLDLTYFLNTDELSLCEKLLESMETSSKARIYSIGTCSEYNDEDEVYNEQYITANSLLEARRFAVGIFGFSEEVSNGFGTYTKYVFAYEIKDIDYIYNNVKEDIEKIEQELISKKAYKEHIEDLINKVK